ncbi:fumarylacetoacetate hydrolase family protein [Rhizobium mongolense]|uniref:fumarylacetoacetate hydrolase family protein n=1 Tax=Rhizobium TaxID=379 RepID=UPI0024B24F5D|nr:fumarylacetoacetate hydrolase family protein [Rhizobium sp. CC1099]WFU87693.1 fumarylacetoacetate hydrolase family protein [Rhizobium sp. CC1099]
MVVKVTRFTIGGEPLWGILDGEEIAPLEGTFVSTADILRLPPAELRTLAGVARFPISSANILSPVSAPAQIICQGLNYADHAHQSGHAPSQKNLLFMKAASSLSGAFDPVIRPAGCQMLDYEVELGLVLKRPLGAGDHVTRETLGDFIGGLVLCNDVSARDVMFGEAFLQWFRGKSARTFCPCGPWLVIPEADEVADLLDRIEIRLWLNDELRQSAHTRDFVFRPETCLNDIVSLMDLSAGDLVLTGTPGGVILQANAALAQILTTKLFKDSERKDAIVEEATAHTRYLAPGDILRAEMRTDDRAVDFGRQLLEVVDA